VLKGLMKGFRIPRFFLFFSVSTESDGEEHCTLILFSIGWQTHENGQKFVRAIKV